ncbi:MAG TPA: GatB/YqeY domain-containing protein [Candidatus Paceibacterota bacterium]|nr:GatB/YqeY domain-containing protein [Candidatus Paceibacterota bacterium]
MTQQDIKAAMIAAMKAKEPVKLAVMRGLIAACTNELVSKGRGPDGVLTEDEVLSVIVRASKQRKDSIEQFEAGGRPELAESEKAELDVLATLLPAQMSKTDVEAAAKVKAAEMGIADKTGANQLMGALMKDLKGKADGTMVKEVVDDLFA